MSTGLPTHKNIRIPTNTKLPKQKKERKKKKRKNTINSGHLVPCSAHKVEVRRAIKALRLQKKKKKKSKFYFWTRERPTSVHKHHIFV
jgi:hypothetical protein